MARRLLLCRYYGSFKINDPLGGILARERLLGRASFAHRLGRKFDRLTQLTAGSYTCPVDHGATLYAIFKYENEADVPVTIYLEGCRTADNGHLKLGGFEMSLPLLGQLERLTGA
jgi:hypothetical protein